MENEMSTEWKGAAGLVERGERMRRWIVGGGDVVRSKVKEVKLEEKQNERSKNCLKHNSNCVVYLLHSECVSKWGESICMILQLWVAFINVPGLLWTAPSHAGGLDQSKAIWNWEKKSNSLTESGTFAKFCVTAAVWCVNKNDKQAYVNHMATMK